MKKKRNMIIAAMLAALLLSLVPYSIASAESDDSSDYNLSKITKTWKNLSDIELNDYIGNNNDADLYEFISGMDSADRAVLRSRNTMLNNTITIDRGDGHLEEMPYYEWITENGSQVMPSMLRMARGGIVSTFTAKSGYCFYRFADEDSGYIVRYKVTFTLDSTANAESQYNDYTVGSVIYATAGEDLNNTKLNKVTFEKQQQYMKKAATSYVELSDGSDGMIRDGERIYPTAITPVFVLKMTVPKPKYTYGEWNTEGFSIGNTEQKLAKGSRFNFRTYNWQCTGDTTFDNKVYHSDRIDTLTSCVNILSCGFTVENTGSLGLADGVPENDTINIVYKHPILDLDFYVNGGEVSETAYNADGKNPVSRSVTYNDIYSSKYGLPEATSIGFKKTGYKPAPGKEWKSKDGNLVWDESNTDYTATDLLDFEEGSYFKSKTRAMFVNWDPNVYKVTLDNQGADLPGTEYTWYKYKTYEKQTLADGTEQNNYYYTSESLSVPLKYGYRIEKPVREGYTFKGYFSEKNGQGTKYVTANGYFTNQLWKTIGPHTLYALWEEKPPEIARLVIRRTLDEKDYHSSHGDATFVFKVMSGNGEVYYRTISFSAADLAGAKDGVVMLQAECILPYGAYTIDALEVFRYENKLSGLTAGVITAKDSGNFVLDSACKEVVADYEGSKTDWQRFSHNDLLINSLDE